MIQLPASHSGLLPALSCRYKSYAKPALAPRQPFSQLVACLLANLGECAEETKVHWKKWGNVFAEATFG